MSYRDSFLQDLGSIKDDVETIKIELEKILDMDDIEDMRIAISETINTVDELIREFE